MRKKAGIVGISVGDEGKAKVLTYFVFSAIENLDFEKCTVGKPVLVERFQGGGNAGHTIEIDGIRYKLKNVPSGVPFKHTYNLMGGKTFVNPRSTMEEIIGLIADGVTITEENFGIAANAHVTLDYHINEDLLIFNSKRRTSTGSGIKQTAVDKQGRVGIRFMEFLDPDVMKEALERRFPRGFPDSLGSIDEFIASYDQERDFLNRFAILEHVARDIHGSQFWIGEGAQGAILDVDDGLYPGITSSNPLDVPNRPETIVGVVKLYNSSTGADRPFICKMDDHLEDELRERFEEYGTKTGLARDVGWGDTVAWKYGAQVANVDSLVATCGDKMEVFAKMGLKVKLVVAYEINGKRYDEWDASFMKRNVLYEAKPVFEEFEPWDNFTDSSGEKLTSNADRYVSRVQELVGKEIIMLGTGPGYKEMIVHKDPFRK